MRKCLLIAIALILFAGTANANVWDLTTDFSISNGNPNGPWSYGTGDSNGFTAFTASGSNSAGFSWWGSASPGPYVAYFPVALGGAPANSISLHPGPGYEPAIVRWTAPTGISSYIDVNVAFLPGDSGSMAVGIFKNGSWADPLWTGIDSGVFHKTIAIAAGDTLDFAVYGSYYSGNTPLEVTISTVPEPSTLAAWSSLGIVGAFVALRRRGRSAP